MLELRRIVLRNMLLMHNKDIELLESINKCDLINIDGMGIVWGARWLGVDVPERVSGIDLFIQLVSLSSEKQYPIFFLGAKDRIVKQTEKVLRDKFPDLIIAGSHHGCFWEDELVVVEKINSSGARLLFVAITSPKKENFINKWKAELGVNFVMGVGGSFDVISGKVKRASIWMRKSGLEWLFRLMQEPRRMFKCYLVTNTLFLMLIIKNKIVK